MASPDLDDGWLKYAHELDTALAVADFTKGARIVLREVFAQIYGPAKAQTAVISPSAIAEGYGMIRQNVSRAIKELTDANVLVKVSDGVFRFVKDYESWLKNDSPRLSPKEVECCQTAPVRAMSWKRNGGGKRVSGSIHEGINLDTKRVSGSIHEGINLDTKRVSGSIHEGINLDTKRVSGSIPPMPPPYRNGRAEFETEGDWRLKETPPNPQGGDEVGEPTTLRSQRRVKVDPDQLQALTDWARAVIGDRGEMEFYFSKIQGWACSYPLDWIETAILCTAAGADKIDKLAPHTNKCLINWHPHGPPKSDLATAERQRSREEKSKAQDTAISLALSLIPDDEELG